MHYDPPTGASHRSPANQGQQAHLVRQKNQAVPCHMQRDRQCKDSEKAGGCQCAANGTPLPYRTKERPAGHSSPDDMREWRRQSSDHHAVHHLRDSFSHVSFAVAVTMVCVAGSEVHPRQVPGNGIAYCGGKAKIGVPVLPRQWRKKIARHEQGQERQGIAVVAQCENNVAMKEAMHGALPAAAGASQPRDRVEYAFRVIAARFRISEIQPDGVSAEQKRDGYYD